MARVRAMGRRNRAQRSASSGALAASDAERQAQLEEALTTQMAMQRKLHEQLEVRVPDRPLSQLKFSYKSFLHDVRVQILDTFCHDLLLCISFDATIPLHGDLQVR